MRRIVRTEGPLERVRRILNHCVRPVAPLGILRAVVMQLGVCVCHPGLEAAGKSPLEHSF